MLLLIVLLPFVGSLLPLLLRGYVRSWTAAASALPAAAALLLLAQAGPAVFAGEVLVARVPWVPALGLELTIRLDGLAWMFGLLVFGIGLLIILYARYYLSEQDAHGRFFFLLLLFMGAMAGVVLSGNLLLLVLFWELTSLTSFLLIGYRYTDSAARRGARMALVVTAAGGLALLGGVLLIGRMVGSLDLSTVLASRELIVGHPHYRAALLLLLLGAFTKSAQVPFHFWLPQAMAAPTPVSAYLHSATMVKAGVFLLARFYPVLAGTAEWSVIVSTVGAATLLLGAYAALFKDDLKGLLAYSTISHLGLITLLFGLGTPHAPVAAVFHIINHATFKASLFMAAGIVDHETGTRDMRVLNGLWRVMPYTAVLAGLAAAAMAGVPLLNGFLSKEMFFAEALEVEWAGRWAVLAPAVALLAGIFSVAYSARFVYSVFIRGSGTGMPKVPHEPPRFMRVPVEILVVLVVVVGIVPELAVSPLLRTAARPVLGGALPEFELHLWHGFNVPLLMSLVALVGGAVVYWKRRRVRSLHDRYLPTVDATDAYHALLDRAVAGARAFTGGLENGSLQRYAALFVATAVVAGLAPAWRFGWTDGPLRPMPVDGASAAAWLILVAAALATAVLHRRRLAALVTISVTGLLVSLAFVRFSAPDLALTQLLVEVVTIVLLLLALHFLPQFPPPDSSVGRRVRDGALAAVAGVGAGALAWAVLTRPSRSIAGYFIEQSKPGGGGTNVVNVILVDFRGFDTLGEVTVIGIAALGIYLMLSAMAHVDVLDAPRYARDRFPVILRMMSRPLLPFALLISIFLLLRGHNLPGGGFIAALLTAVALLVHYLASGIDWMRARLPIDFRPLIGAGVLIALVTGLGSWAFDRPFLSHTFGYVTLPVVGEFELATALLFDLGVYVTVVAAVVVILGRLGRLLGGDPEDAAYRAEGDPWKP